MTITFFISKIELNSNDFIVWFSLNAKCAAFESTDRIIII